MIKLNIFKKKICKKEHYYKYAHPENEVSIFRCFFCNKERRIKNVPLELARYLIYSQAYHNDKQLDYIEGVCTIKRGKEALALLGDTLYKHGRIERVDKL